MPSFLCLSSCAQISFAVTFDTGNSMKIWHKSPNLVKIIKNIVHFTRRPRLVLLLSTTLNRHKSTLFHRKCIRIFVRPSVRSSICSSLRACQRGSHLKFYLGEFYENLFRISSTFSWNRTKLSVTLFYMMTQVDLLLPVTLNRHKIPLLESNGMRLLGEPKRYKHYGKAPQRYFYTYAAYLL